MGVKLWKRGNFYSLVICQEGRRERRALNTSDRKKAEAVLREVESSLVGGQWNVKLAAETILSRGIKLYQEGHETDHHAESTQTYTRGLFSRFTEFIKRRFRRDVVLDRIKKEDIEAFLRERAKDVVSRRDEDGEYHDVLISTATVNRDLRDLRAFFSSMMGCGRARVNPAKGVKPRKGIVRLKKPMIPNEIGKLVAVMPERLADMSRLILNTALRLGEGTHLRASDVDLETRTIEILSRPDYRIKTRQERVIKMNRVVYEILKRRLPKESGALVFGTKTGTLISNRNAERDLENACKKAGIRHCTWYLMRHTNLTEMAKRVPQLVLAKYAGNSVRVLDGYYVHFTGDEYLSPVVAS